MVILDTSVIFKWFESNEENRDKALEFLSDHQNKKSVIVVPDLLFYELSNAWATKVSLPVKSIRTFLEDLQDANLKIESINFKFLKQAILIAKKFKTSVYDAVYIALAKQKKCQFITADQKLISKVNLPFVRLL